MPFRVCSHCTVWISERGATQSLYLAYVLLTLDCCRFTFNGREPDMSLSVYVTEEDSSRRPEPKRVKIAVGIGQPLAGRARGSNSGLTPAACPAPPRPRRPPQTTTYPTPARLQASRRTASADAKPRSLQALDLTMYCTPFAGRALRMHRNCDRA